MSNREYHADGLEFAFNTFTALTTANTVAPTAVQITNALEHIKNAAKFLREEQAAFNVIFPSLSDE